MRMLGMEILALPGEKGCAIPAGDADDHPAWTDHGLAEIHAGVVRRGSGPPHTSAES